MRTAKALALFLVAWLAFPVAGSPQAPDSSSTACNRAWLDSDWPTVAVECATTADGNDKSAERYEDDETNQLPADSALASAGRQVIAPTLLFAGMAWARAAIGNAKLNKPQFFADAQAKALNDLTRASSFGGDFGRRAAALKDLVASKSFVADASDSPLLVHI